MMFKKLAVFAGAVTMAASLYAGQQQACPDINEIKAEGFMMTLQIQEGLFLDLNLSSYNTDKQWGFLMGPIEAQDEDAAMMTGNSLLNTMTAAGLPMQDQGDVFCVYETGNQDMVAIAVQTDGQQMPDQMTFKRLMHKIR